VGFRDVPGKPAIYGTTKEFLDYFGLKKLDDLPPLADLRDLESVTAQLELSDAEALPAGAGAPLLVRDGEECDESAPELATVIPIHEPDSYVDDEPASNVVPLKVR
jgi:segregation and condensation protein B